MRMWWGIEARQSGYVRQLTLPDAWMLGLRQLSA